MLLQLLPPWMLARILEKLEKDEDDDPFDDPFMDEWLKNAPGGDKKNPKLPPRGGV